jgi:UDP-N-acetyl-D-mannosaminuronate dehydrogenase
MQFLMTALIGLAVIGLPTTSTAAAVIGHTTQVDMRSKILMKMESPAEDMLDKLAVKNMNTLKPSFKKLAADMVELNQLNVGTGLSSLQSKDIALLNSWFDLISLEMKEMDDVPALEYAINQFSGQLIVAVQFQHEYERNVDWMDYLGRDIALLNQPADSAPNAALVKIRKNDLQVTWDDLKPLMAKTHKGVALIRRVDPIIRELMIEKRPDRLVVLAQQEQELVDKIEVFFHLN